MGVTRWTILTSPALFSDRGLRLRLLPRTLLTDRVTLLRRFIRTIKREADRPAQLAVVLPTAMDPWTSPMDNGQPAQPPRRYIPIPFPMAVRRLRHNGRTSRLLRCRTRSPSRNNRAAISTAWPLRRTIIPPLLRPTLRPRIRLFPG